MIQRNCTRTIPGPVLFAAALAVLVDMHLLKRGTFGWADILIIFLTASLLIQFGRTGLGVALGIVLYLVGFQCHLQLSSPQFLPFEEEAIQMVRGSLSDDPAWFGPHTVKLQMRCTSVETAEGLKASADCDVFIFLNAGNMPADPFSLGRGAYIAISGAFAEGSNPQREFVFQGKDIPFFRMQGRCRQRQALLRAVRRKCGKIGEDTEVLLPALILGMNHPLKSRFSELFRKSGTAHIMALSGFHAGLVGLLLFVTGRLLWGTRGAYVFSMAGLVFFLWLVGFRPSLVRAVGMYLLFALGKLTHKSFSGLPVLLVTYFCCGIVDPLSIDSLSSQLSYLALGGILISGGRLNVLMEGTVPSWLRLPLCASLGAQLWTTGLVLLVFGESYPIGLLASLVLTPLITIYLYSGILWLLLPSFPFLLSLFRFWLKLLERVLHYFGMLFGGFQPVEWAIEGPGPFLLFLIPVLLLEFYRPGRFHGQRKAGSELRFHFRNKSLAGDYGARTPETLGTEFPD